MVKVFFRHLQRCNEVATSISNASPTQLQQLKTGFAIPQLWLGYGVLAGLDQPAEHVFVWVVLIALLFAGLNGVTMFMIGKGSMCAVKLHLTLAVISLVLTAAYLLVALSGSAAPGVSLTAALVSIGMLLLSGSCILSTAFYKMLLFTLHNRAWHKLLSQTRAKTVR